MARKQSLNTYENQSLLSVLLAATGGVATCAAIWLLFRNRDANFFQTYWISYSQKSSYLPMLAATLLVALLSSGAGFLVAFNSAGQKRNTRSRLAWVGFFLSAAVATLALCAGIVFAVTHHPVNN